MLLTLSVAENSSGQTLPTCVANTLFTLCMYTLSSNVVVYIHRYIIGLIHMHCLYAEKSEIKAYVGPKIQIKMSQLFFYSEHLCKQSVFVHKSVCKKIRRYFYRSC
jgi:hypothetical protein